MEFKSFLEIRLDLKTYNVTIVVKNPGHPGVRTYCEFSETIPYTGNNTVYREQYRIPGTIPYTGNNTVYREQYRIPHSIRIIKNRIIRLVLFFLPSKVGAFPVLTNLQLDPFERTGLPNGKDGGSLYFKDFFVFEFWRFVQA